jgi:hypothetical protein
MKEIYLRINSFTKTKTPTTKVNQPKAGFNFAAENFPAIALPTMIPTTDMAEILNKTSQLIG